MKALLSFIAVAVIMINAAWTTPALEKNKVQDESIKAATNANPTFAFLRTHRMSTSVVATWGLSNNDGVASFQVQRTYEDPTDPYSVWEEIGNIPCSASRSYKHTDNNVLPGYIHYRVVAVMTDGSTVISEVATARIVSR